MIIPRHSGYSPDGRRLYFFGGGGGGKPTETTSNVNQSNIPEYARPYVENMLGATQRQLFTGTQGAPQYRDIPVYSTVGRDGHEVQTGTRQELIPGSEDFQITGFQPYKAYGGTYDASGNQTSYDPSKSIAGFQPLQTSAQQGIAGLQVPGQYGAASSTTQDAMNRAMSMQYNPSAINYQQVSSPYLQDYQMGPAQQVSSQQFGTPMIDAAQSGYRPDLQNYQMKGPDNVQGQNIYAQNIQSAQMGPAQQVGIKSIANQGTIDQYMSPYMQNVVGSQQRDAQRQSDILATQQQAQAVQSGAFGGGRDAIARAERERNLALQKGDIQAQGSQAAFQQAQQQFNTEQQAGLVAQQANQQAGLTTGTQNLNARQQTNIQNAANQLQAQGMSAQQAMQAALANQQAQMSTGQQNLNANLQTQQLGANIGSQFGLANLSNRQQANIQNQAAQLQAQGMNAQQAMQAALANQQAGLSVGQQNLNSYLQTQQLGAGQNMQSQLANQQAMAQAQQLQAQQQQFGANYGLQGIQAGMQGANQLASLGGQQLQAQQGIYGLQNTVGGQQQQYYQQLINQAMQDYANAQQYPLMQLGTMSNMIRGLPMQASTTQQYQAQANPITQGIGAAGAAASLYNAYGGGKAEGGVIKKMASGGITSIPRYDVGGAVQGQLMNMDDQSLAREAKESPSPEIKRMAQAILKQRQAGMNAEGAPQSQQGTGPMNVDYNANYAGGGIIAFSSRGEVDAAEAQRLANQTAAYVDGAKAAAAERAAPSEGITNVPLGNEARHSLEPVPAAITSLPANSPRSSRAAELAAARNYQAPQASPAEAPQTETAPQAAAPQAAAPRPSPAPAQNTGIKAAQPTPEVDPFADSQKIADTANAEAKKTILDRVKEGAEARKALGLDTNEAQAEYMKGIMAQKANINEEAERNKQLRLAEFFASWGSTPGNTLVAGMTALKNKIPDMIADVKEQRKALGEADKVLYELGQAKRKEDLGYVDEAAKQKDKAAELAMHLNTNLTTAKAGYASHKLSAAASIESHKISSAASIRHAEIMAGAQKHAADVQDRAREEAAKGRLAGTQFTALSHASEQLAALPAKLERGRAGNKEYESAVREESMLNAQLKNDPTNKDLLEQHNKALGKLGAYRKADAEVVGKMQAQVDALAKKAFGADFTPFSAPSSTPDMNTQDTQALEWANKNPNDPRAAAIKQRLGQ